MADTVFSMHCNWENEEHENNTSIQKYIFKRWHYIFYQNRNILIEIVKILPHVCSQKTDSHLVSKCGQQVTLSLRI